MTLRLPCSPIIKKHYPMNLIELLYEVRWNGHVAHKDEYLLLLGLSILQSQCDHLYRHLPVETQYSRLLMCLNIYYWILTLFWHLLCLLLHKIDAVPFFLSIFSTKKFRNLKNKLLVAASVYLIQCVKSGFIDAHSILPTTETLLIKYLPYLT